LTWEREVRGMSVRSAVVMLGCFGIAMSAIVACEEELAGGPGVGTSGALGDGGTGGPLAPGTTPPAGAAGDFCQKTLGVVVGALEACCTEQDKQTADYKFTGGIAAKLLPVCTSALEASVTKNRVLYRGNKADACYAAYRTTYAPGKCENLTQTYADPAGTACREAFTGVGETGAPCMGDHECVEGLTCVGYTKIADGTCKAPPAIGEDCGPGRSDAGSSGSQSLEFGSHPACAAGARCDVITSKCVKAAAEGEDCSSTDECGSSLAPYCVRGRCGANGPGGEGATCLDDEDCTPDVYCSGTAGLEGTCTKKKPAGGSCTGGTFVTECLGRCNASPGASGTCASFCGSR
jgi:hypothetical protein